MCKHAVAKGVWGHTPPIGNFQIKYSQIASEAILGQNSNWNSSFSAVLAARKEHTYQAKRKDHIYHLVLVNFQVYTQDTLRYIE